MRIALYDDSVRFQSERPLSVEPAPESHRVIEGSRSLYEHEWHAAGFAGISQRLILNGPIRKRLRSSDSMAEFSRIRLQQGISLRAARTITKRWGIRRRFWLNLHLTLSG